MLYKIRCKAYGALAYTVKSNYENGGKDKYSNLVEHAMALYSNDDGALCIKNQKKVLAGADKPSAQQFMNLIDDLLKDEGIIRYAMLIEPSMNFRSNIQIYLVGAFDMCMWMSIRIVTMHRESPCTNFLIHPNVL